MAKFFIDRPVFAWGQDLGGPVAVAAAARARTNADAVAEWRAGDDKMKKKKRGFLMGEAMKALKGQGNPQLLNRLLDEKLGLFDLDRSHSLFVELDALCNCAGPTMS